MKKLNNPEARSGRHALMRAIGLGSAPPDVETLLDGRVVVKRSARARRLALRLDHKDRVFHLVVPRGVSTSKAMRFAHDHACWMEEKLEALPPPVHFTDGAVLPLWGEETTLHIVRDAAQKRTRIMHEPGRLTLLTQKTDVTAQIVSFIKEHARAHLSGLVHAKAARIDKSVQSIRIGDMKSRWGSCSAAGRISLSWRLVFAPPAAFDYVVAHEVAHLRHLDHSQAFWALCRHLSEDYRQGRRWMRINGHTLMRYGAADTQPGDPL